MRIEPPPSLPVQIGIIPDDDRGRRAARRTAGSALGIPRIAGHAVQVRARPVGRAELGRRREPDEHRARGLEPRGFGVVARPDGIVVQQRAVRVGPTLDRHELLHAHRHAGPRSGIVAARDCRVDRRRPRPRALDVEEAERVQLGVELLDPFDEDVEQLGRTLLTARERHRRAPTRRVSQTSVMTAPRSCAIFSISANASSIPPAEHLDVGARVAVGPQPEMQRAVVRQDPDDDGQVPRERHDRERLEQPRAHQVQRLLRAGHVRDDEVQERLAVHDPRREAHQRRRDVLRHAEQHLRADRLAPSP